MPAPMNPKVKGLFKGLKYITQIFVYKEQEMEIGHPTDVKHVAHIGFDSDSGSAPSWMNQFKPEMEITPSSLNGLSSSSLNDLGLSIMASLSYQDFKQQRRWQSSSLTGNSADGSLSEISKPSEKKKKRKKANVANVSSPTTSISSSRASFSTALEEPIESPTCLPAPFEEGGSQAPTPLHSTINESLGAKTNAYL